MSSIVIQLLINVVILSSFVYWCMVLFFKLWLGPTKFICKCKTVLNEKTVLITGGNSGIGLETARELARRGARVIIASRNIQKSELAVKNIIETTGNQKVEFKYLDLSKLSSVKEFADDMNKELDRLDILINNAGAAGFDNINYTEDGIEYITQVNYIGPFLLTNLLLNKLAASKPSRIVIISSLAHHFNRFDLEDLKGTKVMFLNGYFKYCNSKLMQIMWMRGLAKRLPAGVTVNALHPGLVHTDVWAPAPMILRRVLTSAPFLFKTPYEAAQATLHQCLSSEIVTSGGYYYDSKPARTARIAEDDRMIEKLWEETLYLIKNAKSSR